VESYKLPDQLQSGLRIVFVGTAASQRSADEGAYYAHPGNRFWGTLFDVGLTARRYAPHEFRTLLTLGIGFTDLCKTAAGTDKNILVRQTDVDSFVAKIAEHLPKAIAFTSKNAASPFLGQRVNQIKLGRQSRTSESPEIFVLSSPSGAAASHWNDASWRELAKWAASQ
jgi:double-stranded uracil-DNA glycosylase